MPKKPFRVVELGTGPRAKKLVDLSVKARHANVEFAGMETWNEARDPKYGGYLLSRGKSHPPNLRVQYGKSALQYLSEQPDNSINHTYAHWLLQHMRYADRQVLYREIMRTLKPGARFATIEDGHYDEQLCIELRNQGFQVSRKRATPEFIQRLGTDNADMNARHHMKMYEDMMAIPEKLPKKLWARAGIRGRQDAIRADMTDTRRKIRAILEKREGKKPGPEIRKAIDRIVVGVGTNYSGKPFVIIWARKPRK